MNDRGRMAALVTVATVTVMSTMAIAPSLPGMAKEFAATPHAELLSKLALTMPAIVIALISPFAGWIIDRFGRLPMLYACLALYGAAGTAGYFLDSLYAILVSRLFLGLAIAGIMTTIQTLAGDYFQMEGRARYAALQSTVMSFAALLLVAAGGVIADFNWRGPFLLYFYGWLLLPVIAKFLDEPPRIGHHEAAAGDARFPVGDLTTAYLVAMFSTIMFYMVAVQLPFLMIERGITSGLAIGIVVGMVQLFSGVGAMGHPHLRRNYGFRGVFAIAHALMAIGYALIWIVPSYAVSLIGALIAGIGVGLFFPNATLWVLTLAPPAYRGRCTGGTSAAFNLGQFVSPIVMQPAVIAVGLGGSFGVAAGLMFVLAAGLAVAERGRA